MKRLLLNLLAGFALILTFSNFTLVKGQSKATVNDVRNGSILIVKAADQSQIGATPDTLIKALSTPTTRLYWSQKDGVTIQNTSTETSIFGTTDLGTVTLPANVAASTKYVINSQARFSTLAVNAAGVAQVGTLTINVYVGGILVGSTTIGSLVSGAQNANFALQCRFTIKRSGSSGLIYAQGNVDYPGPLLDVKYSLAVMSGSLTGTAVDLSKPVNVDIRAIWSNPSPSNSFTSTNNEILVLN